MVKTVLLGAGGQLGKEWLNFLKRAKGITFKTFDSSEVDITNLSSVYSVLDEESPDIIINCAAYTAVDQAEEDKEQANLVNHLAVKKLAEACKEKGIKLIHFSTDYIFPGDTEDKERLPKGYPEDAETRPINFYGKTKWLGEQAIRDSGCNYLIIRVSWLCGRYGNNFLKTMLHLADKKTQLSIVGDQFGSPTFTKDVVKKTHILLEKGLSGTYHITSKGITTWADFAKHIFESAGKNIEVQPIPTSEYPTKAERPKFSKLNTQKIEQVEGLHLMDWKQGTRELVKLLQNN